MGSAVPQLIVVAVLILLNAAFAGTELALVSLREGQLQRLEQRSSTGALLARLARQPNQFLATIQIGITLAGFLASAAAAVSLAEPLVEPLSFLGGAAEAAAIFVVTLILTYFTLVFGELAPKRVAMQRAERWGMVMARPLAVLSKATRPVVWLLSRSTDLVVRIVGADPSLQRADVTTEELRDMVAAQSSFSPDQRFIISGAFDISERTLDEVLVPRRDVFLVDARATCRETLSVLAEGGHTRAPVATSRNIDHVVGVVHLRQLIGHDDASVSDRMSAIPSFPATARALSTLRSMQQHRVQMALVVNEHGGAEGIVTIEDLVEELVGEIYDETDKETPRPRHHGDGSISVPGRFPVRELPTLGIDLPSGEYSTLAGLMLDGFGHIPTEVGEQLDIGDWTLTVEGIEGRTISEVLLRARGAEERD